MKVPLIMNKIRVCGCRRVVFCTGKELLSKTDCFATSKEDSAYLPSTSGGM